MIFWRENRAIHSFKSAQTSGTWCLLFFPPESSFPRVLLSFPAIRSLFKQCFICVRSSQTNWCKILQENMQHTHIQQCTHAHATHKYTHISPLPYLTFLHRIQHVAYRCFLSVSPQPPSEQELICSLLSLQHPELGLTHPRSSGKAYGIQMSIYLALTVS